MYVRSLAFMKSQVSYFTFRSSDHLPFSGMYANIVLSVKQTIKIFLVISFSIIIKYTFQVQRQALLLIFDI